MRARRCRFVPQMGFLSSRIVPSATMAADVGSSTTPDDSDLSDGSDTADACDASIANPDDGSSDDGDPGIDPMEPQLPSDMEYTVATPVCPTDAYA